MIRLGKILHYTNNYNLIVRAKNFKHPILKKEVFDEELKNIGFISDIFGPTSSPYIAVKTNLEKPKMYLGKMVYVARG